MKSKLIKIATVALLAAGISLAQGPGFGPRAGRGAGFGPRAGMGMGRMADQLGLTDDQKAQAKEIFQASRDAAQPLHQQMRDARQQLATDVKNGAAQDVINKDTAQVGSLAGQLATLRAQTMTKFYGILTPDQKTKLDTMHANRRGRNNG